MVCSSDVIDNILNGLPCITASSGLSATSGLDATMILLVTVETILPRPLKDFGNVLERRATRVLRIMRNVWLMDTQHSPDDLSEYLFTHLSDGDRVFVTRLASENNGRLNSAAWHWLRGAS